MSELKLTFTTDASSYINISSGGISKSCYLSYRDSGLAPAQNSILVNENTTTSYTSNCEYLIFSDSQLKNSSTNNPPYDVYCIIIHSLKKIFYVQNGEPKILNYKLVGSYTITCDNSWSVGISSLSVTADNGINHVLYNNVTYDTFPATIPLDANATTMQVESKTPVLTINDGGNLKSVTYGSATYTKFPATVTATTPEFALTARGKDSPVITVRTDRTQTPVITNT